MSPERQKCEAKSLFGKEAGFARNAVWVCAIYSMVPYLGIVFVPIALAWGLFVSARL